MFAVVHSFKCHLYLENKCVSVSPQDKVSVHVIPLEGIKIFAPLKRLQTDTQMPLYAVGTNDNQTPFTFGSAAPPRLSFYWSTSNQQVAQLKPLFHQVNSIQLKPLFHQVNSIVWDDRHRCL